MKFLLGDSLSRAAGRGIGINAAPSLSKIKPNAKTKLSAGHPQSRPTNPFFLNPKIERLATFSPYGAPLSNHNQAMIATSSMLLQSSSRSLARFFFSGKNLAPGFQKNRFSVFNPLKQGRSSQSACIRIYSRQDPYHLSLLLLPHSAS